MKEVVATKTELFGLSEEAVGRLVQAVAYGRPMADVAAEHGLTVAEVRTVIDRMAVSWFDGPNLRREMMLEVQRLSALGKLHFIKAMKGDLNSSMMYLKICERRSILTGMTPMQGHAITVINQTVQPERKTTTEEISSIIDEIRRLPQQ